MTNVSEFRMVPAAEMPLGDEPLLWPERPPSLAATLAIAGEVGERFRMSVSDHDHPGFMRADALSDEDLARGIGDRGRGVGTDEERVATALFLQTYAYRVAAPMLAAWVLHGRVPDVSAGNVGLRFDDQGRPADLALRTPRVYALPGDEMPDAEVIPVSDLTGAAIATLLSSHLLPVMERLRVSHRLGLLLAKGAVASQIGMALTFIDGQSAVPWQRTTRIALDFFDRTAGAIAGQGKAGDMGYKCMGEREGVTFRRRTCCLVFRVPDKGYCGGCPLRADGDLLDTWRTRLLARPVSNLVTAWGRSAGEGR